MPRKTRLALMGAAIALASTGVTVSIAGVASASGSPTVTTNYGGSYSNGETVTVSGTGFPTPSADPSGIEIMECSSAILTADVQSTAYCDGSTLNPLPIPTNSAGDFTTPYQITTLETSSGSNINCDASNSCVLWVGEDYNNDFIDPTDQTFGNPFLIAGTGTMITTTPLSGSTTQGSAFSDQLAASLPSTFSESGAPSGIGITSGGLINGAAYGAAGTYPISVTATSTGTPTSTDTETFTLTVNAAASLAIADNPPPNAVVGQPYSYTLHAVGSYKAPLQWKAAGKLPKDIKLNKATGVISGTNPMASKPSKQKLGKYTFTAEVKDHSKPKKTASLSLSITLVS